MIPRTHIERVSNSANCGEGRSGQESRSGAISTVFSGASPATWAMTRSPTESSTATTTRAGSMAIDLNWAVATSTRIVCTRPPWVTCRSSWPARRAIRRLASVTSISRLSGLITATGPSSGETTWSSRISPATICRCSGRIIGDTGRKNQYSNPAINNSRRANKATRFQGPCLRGRATKATAQLGHRGLWPGRRTNRRLHSGSVQITAGAVSSSPRR